MCSVSDDLGCLSLTSSTSTVTLLNANCKKCRIQPAEMVLQLKDAYCRNCLLLYVNHRFRACLGKSKLIKPKEKVLVAISGSMASATLLDLIHCGLGDTTPKRLMFSPVLVFIDDGVALGLSYEKCSEIFQEMKDMLSNGDLPAFYVPLESIVDFKPTDVLNFRNTALTDIIKKEQELGSSVSSKLQEIFGGLKSSTAKEDLLMKLRNNLLMHISAALECTKILTAETGTHLSVKLMSNIVIGRGAHLSLDVGFCDSRSPATLLLRPLQDVSKKAVAFYVLFKRLKFVFIPSFTSMERSTSSLQKLTENFLVGLQSEFPSTMSTVFRTGEKMSSNPLSSQSSSCRLCQGPLDVSAAESSAFMATKISSVVSKIGKQAVNSDGLIGSFMKEEDPHQTTNLGQLDNSTLNASLKTNTNIYSNEVLRTFCYGCQLVLAESDFSGTALREISTKNYKISNSETLKEQIKDFLLE